jgi:hypothetical protein
MPNHGLKPVGLLSIVVLAAVIGSGFLVREAGAVSPNPNAKNVTFYFHYLGTPVFIGGTMSHYVMDTAPRFQATNNSVLKPLSQPKIELDFFMYPNLAGPATFNGTWQVIIWANASALKPTVWNTEYQEVSPGGLVVWDSGMLTPSVVGGPATNNGYLDVPIYAYNLSDARLAHTFTQGDSVRVAVTANPGSTVTAQLWYDSRSFPSQAIFPSLNIGQPSKIWTEDSTGFVTSAFPATPGIKVVVNTNVTDPFGGYDVNAFTIGAKLTMVALTITAPNGTVIVNGQRMTLMSGGPLAFNNILQYNVTLVLGTTGQYSVSISSTDNSGNVEQLTATFTLGQIHNLGAYIVDSKNRPLAGSIFTVWSGNFQIFSAVASSNGIVNGTLVSANYTLKVSWQGVTVYQSPISFASDTNLVVVTAVYDVTVIVVDDTSAPLSGAVVSIIHPNGTAIPGLIITGSDGSLSLTRAPAGEFQFTVLWKTVTVYDATVQISSAGPYTLKTMVYQLTVTVRDSTGAPVQGAYVVLYNIYGVVYDFKATDSSGSVTLKVPIGNYTIDAFYSTTYWYTPVTSTASKGSVLVNSSGSLSLTLAGFPPAITSTAAFLVIALSIVAIVAASLATYLVMKKRLPGLLARMRQKTPPQPSSAIPQ